VQRRALSEVSEQDCRIKEPCCAVERDQPEPPVRHGSPGPLAGGWVSVCLPAPVPDHQICCSTGSPEHEDTSKAKQSALEKLREVPDLTPSSSSPPCMLAPLGCQGQK